LKGNCHSDAPNISSLFFGYSAIVTSTLDPILSEVIQSAFPRPIYCNAVYLFQDCDESELRVDGQSVPPSKQSSFLLLGDIPLCLK